MLQIWSQLLYSGVDRH